MTLYKSPLRLIPGFRWPREIMGSPMLPFDFDLAEIVFTPGMAKRATGVFAAAPIIQGAWDGTGVPDVLTFPRGDLLGNQAQDWYANFDPNQGSIVFWIRPEWDGDDGVTHFLFGDYFASSISIFKRFDDTLFICHDTDTLVSTNVAAWNAGTTYLVVARWDRKNTLDGMNFGCMSINDVHDFEGTAAWASVAPPADESIGSDGGAADAADSIIEGLTIYRRPLWDGAYGKDVGNGDELAAIYAAGAGADPCLTTGSWDAVLGVPTDATPGALVTGPGEAWSHPHGAALPEHGFVDDGFGPYQESAILFDGLSTYVNLTSNAAFDDMPDGANGVQAGTWVRFDAAAGSSYIVHKGNWYLRLENDGERLRGRVVCDTLAAYSTAAFADNPQWETQPDGKWHWVVMSFHHIDNGGDNTVYIQVDGKWATTYSGQQVGIGAYTSDAALTLYYGYTSSSIDGAGGWLALWNNVAQYPVGTDNIAPRTKPGAGGNLIEAWQCDDRVSAITATVTTPGNDGLLANGLWERKWNVEATPVMPQSVAMTAGDIDFGSGANIDDLPDNAVAGKGPITVEAYVRADSTGETDQGIIAIKGTLNTSGWSFRMQTGGALRARIECATTSAIAAGGALINDGVPHHVAFTYDETGDRLVRTWVDGILNSTSAVATVGNYVSDAADNLLVGDEVGGGRAFDGTIGWLRVSDNIRYTANFTPNSRQDPPANDGNAHLLVNMDDGAGATATDTSGNTYHGTITAGRWNNTYDMELDSPGARTFQNGYVFGADGVGDGIGHLAVVTAETDYVVRFLGSPGQCSRGLNNLYIYDMTNAAQIGANYQMPSYHGTHTGGAASPTLDDNTARWPQSLIGVIAYNITQATSGAVTAVDGGMQSLTAGINWNNGDEYRLFWADGYHKHPWTETMVFRTPVGCVLVDFRLLSLDGEGTLYVHQVEVQESLLDNGDIEAALVGVPPIPPLWTNQGLDAGDTQAEAAIIHAGAQSMRWNAGAGIGERCISPATGLADGIYAAIGFYSYGTGAVGGRAEVQGAAFVNQADGIVSMLDAPPAAVWAHVPAVWRRTGVNTSMRFVGRDAGPYYIDDAYLYALDPITLTVTPASEANCLESGGIRVVGRATCAQPVVPAALLQATQGWIRWRMRFRHAAANLDAFGEVPGSDYLMRAWGNAVNYVDVYVTAANNIRLEFNDGGGVHLVNWNCIGVIIEDVEYLYAVRWNPVQMQLLVDNVVVSTIAQPPDFAVVPTVVYFGSRNTGDRQGDAVFIDL